MSSYRSFEALASDYDLYQDFETTDKDVVAAFARLVAKETVDGSFVLDLGAGTGNYSLRFAEHGAKVIAGDVSYEMLRILKTKQPKLLQNRLLTGKMDAYSLPFRDESLNVVVTTLLFQHLAQPEQAVAEIKRVLKPDGVLATWFQQHRYSIIVAESPVHVAIARAFQDELRTLGAKQSIVGWSGQRSDTELTRLFDSRRILDSDQLVVTGRNSAGWLLRKIEHRFGGLYDIDTAEWMELKKRVRDSLLREFGPKYEEEEQIQQTMYRIALYQHKPQ